MNLSNEKTKPEKINKPTETFHEVVKGYTFEEMMLEADRCLNCKHQPCVSACPIHVPIPTFISLLKENKVDQAHQVILSRSNFPQICSRVCHVAHQCEGSCVRQIKGEAVGISHLERYVCDHASKPVISIKQRDIKKKVAVIGGGVSGLACALDLSKEGYNVHVYEKNSMIGGITYYGIPNYRLPNNIIDEIYKDCLDHHITFHFGYTLLDRHQFLELKQSFDAVYLAFGEEDQGSLKGFEQAISSSQFLQQVNTQKIDRLDKQRIVVMGGGNTAMDCARCAKRLGANVTIVYRRRVEDMPASKVEIEETIQEGINIMDLTQPIYYREKEIECVKRVVSGLDEMKRVNTVDLQGSNFLLDCDLFILAIGSTPNKNFRKDLGLELDYKGRILVDDTMMTNLKGVFAGGDNVLGADTVVKAVSHGKKAALGIIEYLK